MKKLLLFTAAVLIMCSCEKNKPSEVYPVKGCQYESYEKAGDIEDDYILYTFRDSLVYWGSGPELSFILVDHQDSFPYTQKDNLVRIYSRENPKEFDLAIVYEDCITIGSRVFFKTVR